MTYKNKTLQPGFSFIETLIIITIMGLFIAAVGPKLMSLLGRGYKTSTQSVGKNIAAGIQQYKIDVGTYPGRLEDLVKKPEGASGWQEPYVGTDANPEVPRDAWGQEFRYEVSPRGTKPPYKLWSIGDPDKEEAPIYIQ